MAIARVRKHKDVNAISVDEAFLTVLLHVFLIANMYVYLDTLGYNVIRVPQTQPMNSIFTLALRFTHKLRHPTGCSR